MGYKTYFLGLYTYNVGLSTLLQLRQQALEGAPCKALLGTIAATPLNAVGIDLLKDAL